MCYVWIVWAQLFPIRFVGWNRYWLKNEYRVSQSFTRLHQLFFGVFWICFTRVRPMSVFTHWNIPLSQRSAHNWPVTVKNLKKNPGILSGLDCYPMRNTHSLTSLYKPLEWNITLPLRNIISFCWECHLGGVYLCTWCFLIARWSYRKWFKFLVCALLCDVRR